MKRLLSILFLSIIFLPLVCGCNNQVSNNTEVDNTKPHEINTPNQSYKDFFGKWLIKRKIAFGRVHALSEEDINNYIGKIIEYSASKVSFENDIYEYPTYKKTVISENDFFSSYGYLSFKEIGYQGENIEMIKVVAGYWNNIGSLVWVKDKDTLITSYDGVFFELIKDNEKQNTSKEQLNSEIPLDIIKKGNRNSTELKPIEKMEGYPSASDIEKANIEVLKNELLPYEEFVDKYPEFGTQNNISPDRMIWVSKKHYPKGIITMRGNVKNAILTTYYDAETGVNIGYNTYSLDKDGMELEGPYKNE